MNFSDQVEHARELRATLVDYVASPRFTRLLEERFAAVRPYLSTDFDAWEQAVDELLFARPDDGARTLLERYLAATPDLPDADRAVLQGWRTDSVHGLFQVRARDEELLDLQNLIDDLGYETFALEGAEATRGATRGSYLQARILPVGPAWITSGVLQFFPSRDRLLVGARVARLLDFDPTAAFRNPARVVEARELLTGHHTIFVSLFGTDAITGTGRETEERYTAFLASDAEPAAGIRPFPTELRNAPEVTLLHDPTVGLTVVAGLAPADKSAVSDGLPELAAFPTIARDAMRAASTT